MKKTILAVIMVMLAFALLVSCSDNAAAQKADEKSGQETVTLYKVTFDKADGSDKFESIVESGKTVPEPRTPEQKGFRFLGWYKGEDKFDFSTEITGDLTLTAKWEAKKAYTVTFDTMGGNTVASQTVYEGDKVVEPDDPERKDYLFDYWKTSSNEEFDFDKVLVDSDITLTAVWDYDKVYSVGDTGPAGGVIFYDAGSVQTSTYELNGVTYTYTWRYLEAAGITDSDIQWGPTGVQFGTESAIGTGRSNTAKMFSKATGDDKNPTYDTAADKVWGKDLKNNGYTDWFIPSIEELVKMYENGKTNNNVKSVFHTNWQDYMSSTEWSGYKPTESGNDNQNATKLDVQWDSSRTTDLTAPACWGRTESNWYLIPVRAF